MLAGRRLGSISTRWTLGSGLPVAENPLRVPGLTLTDPAVAAAHGAPPTQVPAGPNQVRSKGTGGGRVEVADDGAVVADGDVAEKASRGSGRAAART